MFGLNYIDGLIIAVLLYHLIRGFYIGFWPLFGRLISFFGAIIGAFLVYQKTGELITAYFNTITSFAYGIGFILSFFVIQFLLSFIINYIFNYIPFSIREHRISKVFGTLPGFLDGMIFLALILMVLFISPIPQSIRDDIAGSKLANWGGDYLYDLQIRAENVFGDAMNTALSYLTTKTETGDTIKIPHKPSRLTVDNQAEIKMLDLVNQERAKVGAPALVMDETIVPVAREHSKDMWERSYFSHENPDGEDPFDRMRRWKVRFLYAGENLALAPNVEVAHRGLMNSPGHKRNILDPKFRRIGIGVIDGGIYGQMYTQNFAG
jgi:uncharacterized protein YkwD/uncharacterized membrane protein required for colicin V production